VLFDQPFTGAAELQPGAVHQQMHGFSTSARPRLGHLQCLASPAQGGVVRHREVKAEKADGRRRSDPRTNAAEDHYLPATDKIPLDQPVIRLPLKSFADPRIFPP
jgi:hypothetical protein